MTTDLRETLSWLRRRAGEPATRWEEARKAVEEAWRDGARAASERLELLEQQRRSLAGDPSLPRTPAARRGLDRALDARRAECAALRGSPEIQRHQRAQEAERIARKELAAASPYEWREYEAQLARLRKDHPGQWRVYEAGEQAAGREPVAPRDWKPLFPGSSAG